MRAWLLTLCCPLLCLVGCRSVQPDLVADVDAGSVPLSRQEMAFAEALAHFGHGLLYEGEEGQNSTNALSSFQAASASDPENHELRSRIAVIALHLKQPEIAIDALEESYQYDTDSYKRCVDLAAVYHAAGQKDAAIAQYKKALKLDSARATVYVALAGLYFNTSDDKAAIDQLKRGIKKADNVALIQLYTYEQAKRFIALNELQRAIPCFELLAEWDEEKRAQFYMVLSEIYIAVGDDDSAIDVLTRVTKLPNPLTKAFLDLAVILFRHDKNAAFEVLRKANEQLNDDPTVLFSLGCFYSEAGKYNEAIPFFERARGLVTTESTNKTVAVDSEPVLTEDFYLYHGAAYERTGEFDKAEALFLECLSFYPKCHRILNYLAYMWAENDTNLDQALNFIRRALELEPNSAAYRDTLGWIYFKQGRLEDALKEIHQADLIMENDAEILLHLGDVYFALDKTDQAVIYWKRSFLADSENKAVISKLAEQGIDTKILLEETQQEDE